MNIFVGNLAFETREADVKKLFKGFGNVISAVIVMQKDGKKSRGFGFVEMLDDQQAQAAIEVLAGKEFMGRTLDVQASRPKTETERKSKLKKKMQPEVEGEAEEYPQEGKEQKKAWVNPVLNKPGRYKGGRRTHSYMKRHGLTGTPEEAKPRRRNQDNPMRRRRRGNQPKPWQRVSGEHKPWKKTEEEGRPWKKTGGESKPWRKSEGSFKPRRKASGESKPWKKPAGESKPWRKSSARPQKSRFNSSRKRRGAGPSVSRKDFTK